MQSSSSPSASPRASKDPRPVDVRRGLSPAAFIAEYVDENRPVIIDDAVSSWRAARWTPESFAALLGDRDIEVTDDGPFPVETMRYPAYLRHLQEAAVSPPPADGSIGHLRYFRFRGDEALRCIEGEWSRPSFMPEHVYGYAEDIIKKVEEYPAFGVFISPRGAASKLHVDGNRTNAIVAQLHGHKRVFLISPKDGQSLPPVQERVLRKAKHLDVETPDFGVKTLVFDLMPGETVFIPHSWFHEVHTLSTSISLTYNFFLPRDYLKVGWWMLKQRLVNRRALDVG